MGEKVLAADVGRLLADFSGKVGIPILKTVYDPEKKLPETVQQVADPKLSLEQFLEFCKAAGVGHLVFSEFVLEKSDLDELLEGEEESDDEEDEDELEEGLSPKAEKIIRDSIERQAKELEAHVGLVGSVAICGFKPGFAFGFDLTDDWYDLYLRLCSASEDLEENGPEILTAEEIVKFNKEMGIRESRESIAARREAELAKKKDAFFDVLSKDKIFLNAKNLTLRLARAERTMPVEIAMFIQKREAVDAATNLFLQRVGEMRAEGKSAKTISAEVGVSEKMLKKYLDLD